MTLYEAGHEVYLFRPSSWSLVVDVLSGAYIGLTNTGQRD